MHEIESERLLDPVVSVTDKRSHSANTASDWIDNVQERDAVFQQLMASDELAASHSPERLSRLPRRLKLFDIRFVYAYVVLSFLLVSFLSLQVVVAKPSDPGRQVFSLIAGVTVIGLLIFDVASAVVLLSRRGAGTVHRADITPLPVIVTAKRAGQDVYVAGFLDSDGERFEYQLWSKRLAEQFYIGDAGIVFVWKNLVVGFDRVLTSQVILESHVQGAVECLHCDSVYRLGNVPKNCGNCGADLHSTLSDGLKVQRTFVSTIFAAFQRWGDNNLIRTGDIRDVANPSLKDQVEGHVTCGWCHHEHDVRPGSPNCQACGGVLPMAAGDPGPKPPPGPRQLPRQFHYDLFFGRQMQLKVGLLVVLSGAVVVFVFPPVGFLALTIGALGCLENLIASWRRWQAWSHGVPVLGQIDRIQCVEGAVITSDSQHDEYRVYFRFRADGQPVRGMTFSYATETAKHFLGEPVWIVHVPDKPHFCAIWPPLP